MQDMTPEQRRAIAMANARRRMAESQSRQRAVGRNQIMSDVIDQQPVTRAVRAGAQAFNLSDEFAGLSTRAGNVFRSEENRIDPQEAARAEEERVARYREERPVSAFAEEMLGGGLVTAPLAGLGAGVRGAMAARPLLTSAAGGATAGAVSGAGGGDDMQSRLSGAGIGAAIGGALGPVAVQASRGLGRVGRAVTDRFTGQRAPSSAAMRVFDRVDDTVAQADPDGSFLGERLGPRGEELLTSLSQRPDGAGEIVQQAARRRQTGRTARVLSEIQLLTGNRRGVDAIADVMEAETTARPLFNAVDRARVPVGGRLRELVRRAANEGINLDQVSRAQPRGELTLASLLSDDAIPDSAVSGQSVRRLIADVEDAASTAYRQGGGNAGGRIGQVARDLRGFLREEVPEFAEASSIWRGARLADRARQLGASVFDEGKNRDVIERELREFVGSMDDMSASERGQFLSGVLSAIERRVGTVGEGGNAASRLTRQNIQDRLSIVFGDQADELADVLSRQNRLAELDRLYQPTQGSPTAARQAAAGAEDRFYGGPIRGPAAGTIDWAGDVLSNPVTRARNLGAGLVRGRMPGAQAEELAGILTQQDNQTAIQRFLQQIEQERARRAAISGSGVVAGTALGAQGGRRQ